MLEEDKECTNCTFDTMAIVTVDIENWKYCPVCGSDLRYPSDEDADDSDDMKKIPINTPTESNSKSTDSQEAQNDSAEVDGETEKSDENDEDDDQEEQVDEFVEEELERLKDNTEDEGEQE